MIFLLVGKSGLTLDLDEAMTLARDLSERAAQAHHSNPITVEIDEITWSVPPDAAKRIAMGLVHEVEGARTRN